MKPLNNLCNAERAILLHDLFPEEMQQLFVFSKATAESILSDPEEFKARQLNMLHASALWFDLAKSTKTTLDQYSDNLKGHSHYLAEHLYSHRNFLFAFHCMHQYLTSGKCMNKQFARAVELLFFFR